MKRLASAAPALIMGVGALLLLGVNRQRAVPLRLPLSSIPTEMLGRIGTDREIPPEEQRVTGMNQYILREYETAFSVYAGFYEKQTDGRTIHSPRNCLPGAGWEPVDVSHRIISVEGRNVRVLRYLLAKKQNRALVYYWYQGRGRVASNEYQVKWELLLDAALRGRTEEALVRIVVPIRGEAGEIAADSVATQVAQVVMPAMNRALPTFP